MSEPAPPLELAYYIGEEISRLRKEIKKLEEQKAMILEDARKDGITKEGPYKLIDKITRQREINTGLFYERYPEIYRAIAKIPVQEAERMIGKEAMEEVSIEKLRSTLTVVHDITPLRQHLEYQREAREQEVL